MFNINQQQQIDLANVPTDKLFEELIIRAFMITPPMGSSEGEDLRARVQSMITSVSDYRFAKRDPFELEEIMKKVTNILIGHMSDVDLKSTIDKLGSSFVNYLDAKNQQSGIFSRNIMTTDLMEMINLFIDFVHKNNIPSVNSYDRFKPIYEKFIAVTPKADQIIGEDVVGFFNKLQQAGLK